MNRFFLKTSIFVLLSVIIATAYYFTSKFVFSKTLGISTSQQINNSINLVDTADYNGIVLGSSCLYRGVNPDSLTFAKTINFAHDNDSYNQIYYKIKYLDNHNKKVDFIIMNADYFTFSRISSSRNSIYSKYLGKEYLMDYKDIANNNLNESFATFIENSFTNSHKQFIKSIIMIVKGKKNNNIYKKNGQMVFPYKEASPNESARPRESYEPLPLQVGYFDKIVNYCEGKNIKLFLIFSPTMNYVLNFLSPQEKAFYDSLFLEKAKLENVYFLDYKSDSRFGIKDFHDFSHLNSRGADKFSSILNQDIQKILLNDK